MRKVGLLSAGLIALGLIVGSFDASAAASRAAGNYYENTSIEQVQGQKKAKGKKKAKRAAKKRA
jgi:hypothetical protein